MACPVNTRSAVIAPRVSTIGPIEKKSGSPRSIECRRAHKTVSPQTHQHYALWQEVQAEYSTKRTGSEGELIGRRIALWIPRPGCATSSRV